LKTFYVSILLFFTFSNVNAQQWSSHVEEDGIVSITGNSAIIQGADYGTPDKNNYISFTANQTQTISFSWNYTTNDSDAHFDPFFYSINNVSTKIPIFDSGSNNSGSGIKSITITAGQTIILGINTLDGVGGSAKVIITNLNPAQNFVYFGLNKYGLITSDNTMQLDINGKITGLNKINKNGKIN
jgi:hypothetical protein